MNLLLLDDADFVSADRAVLHDRRLKHLHEVHRAENGDTLQVGRLGGWMGEGRLLKLDASEATLECASTSRRRPAADHPAAGLAATEDAPPGVADHRRDGRTEAGAAEQLPRGKSFWQTPFLDPAAIRENLVLGLEQARDTVLPEIIVEKRFKPFVEDRLPALAAGSLGLVGHPGPWPACPRAVEKPVTLAIGPEGGWIPYEVDKLREAGLHPVQLGERILRVETAVSALLARLF